MNELKSKVEAILIDNANKKQTPRKKKWWYTWSNEPKMLANNDAEEYKNLQCIIEREIYTSKENMDERAVI